MLNIGRLSPGAADYYLGEIASSAEDYYTGRGESAGRWVGSLAQSMGLQGTVDGAQFRAVLDGRHPFTGEQLARSRSSRAVDLDRRPDQRSLLDDDDLDVSRTATRLRVSVGRVRQLLWAATRDRKPGAPYLAGSRVPREDGRGAQWRVPKHEVERYQAEHARAKARPGYDLTLRPPKSVSVLWALAPAPVRAAIREAHAEAVDQAIAYLETHALYARKGTGRRGRIETDGFIAAGFDHRTSRAGDPLLHTHVVVANLTRTAEGRWQALDARPVFDHARPAGFVYQAHLRHMLTHRLGVRWRRVRNGWAEIDGVPDMVVRAFSKRRDEIEQMVAESGYTSPRAHQSATLATRQAKDYGVDAGTLAEAWRTEASGLGFGDADVAACVGRTVPDQSYDPVAIFDRLGGAEGLTKLASTFARKEVVEALAEALGDRASAQQIEALTDRFLESSRVVALTPGEGRAEWVQSRNGTSQRDIDLVLWSTPELLRLEDDLFQWAEDGFATRRPVSPPASTVDRILNRHPVLSGEQREMVRSLASPQAPPIQPVAGHPGAGKTTATAVYVEILADAGLPVVGCAVAATAAGELEAACHLQARTGRPATTVARLLLDVQREPLPAGAVVIVDEASMVPTRDLHRLAVAAGRAGGAVKLIGDPDQHGAVETGGAFRALAAQAGSLVTLTANNRQLDGLDRGAIEQFREGNVEAALSRYDDAGRVVRSRTAAGSYDAMVADWWAHTSGGGTDPMIAGTNRVRRELNRRARDRMKEAGLLAGPAIVNPDGAEITAGDWVVARRNNKRLTSSDGGWVKNGSAGRVTDVDAARGGLTVAFDREGEIEIPPSYVNNGFVEHGYCRTTYGVQGATLDRAFVHVDDRTGFEEGYVALTRGRRETRLFLVDGAAPATDEDSGHRAHDRVATGLDTVAQAMERRRAGSLAHDADPLAGRIAAELGGWDLGSLRRERDRLEAVLASGPGDVTEALRAAVAREDRLLALQRVTVTAGAGGSSGTVLSRLRRVRGQVSDLRSRHQARLAFLADHAPDVERWETVRRMELAREAQVRTGARADVSVGPGRVAASPVAERAVLAAAEQVAIHVERFGRIDDGVGDDEVTAVVGGRPAGVASRMSYDSAVDAVRAAAALRDAVPADPPRLSDVVEPPSLFD